MASLHTLLTAQSNPALCQSIYVWDVYQENGKKSPDAMIVSDIESAIARNKGTSVLDRRNFQNIPLRIKNEKANQKTDNVSDALAQKLQNEGVKNIFFATIAEDKGTSVLLNIQIYALQTRQIVFRKNLTMPKLVFDNNREKRKDVFADFIKKEVLGVAPSFQKTLIWSGIGVGAAATVVGTLKTLSIKNSWKNYQTSNPFDAEKTYPTKNKSYQTNQYIAIGGAAVLATSAYMLLQKIQKQKRLKKETFSNPSTPKIGLNLEPLFDNTTGLGLAIKF
jgi:hypothetical protein